MERWAQQRRRGKIGKNMLLRQIYGLIDSRPIGRGERATGGVGPLGLTECLKERGKKMVGA